MLILTRRLNETLVIGDDVLITVLGVKGNQIRIGISAPKEISVHRQEVYVKVKAARDESNAVYSELDASLMDAFHAHQQSASESRLTH